MPEGEDLTSLGRTGATLAIHLSVRNLRAIERELTPFYGADCPVIVVYRVGWPDEAFLHSTLSTVRAAVTAAKITRTALIFVGKGLTADQGGFAIVHCMTLNMRMFCGRCGAIIRLTCLELLLSKVLFALAQSSFG